MRVEKHLLSSELCSCATLFDTNWLIVTPAVQYIGVSIDLFSYSMLDDVELK